MQNKATQDFIFVGLALPDHLSTKVQAQLEIIVYVLISRTSEELDNGEYSFVSGD